MRDFKVTEQNKIRCLFIGRLIEHKGIYLLLKIIEELDPSKFEFAIVGKGKMKKQIERFCEERRNCHFLGYQKNPALRAIYDRHDILLLPSIRNQPWEELFGMVLIEGLSRGVIPYATDHTGPKEILGDEFPNHIFSEYEFVNEVINELNNVSIDRSKITGLKQKAFRLGQKYRPDNIYKRWNELLEIEN